MPLMLLGLLKSVLGSMVMRLLTGPMLEWVLLWAAQLVVDSTKTKSDDKLLAKIKEVLDEEEKK